MITFASARMDRVCVNVNGTNGEAAWRLVSDELCKKGILFRVGMRFRVHASF
jgi:hypothetical protein